MTELEQLNRIKYQLDVLESAKEKADITLSNYDNQVKELNEKLEFILESRQLYKKAIDVAYERSVLELKSVLNSALSYIFTDRAYEVDIIISDKRGKSLTLKITDDGKPANLKRGTGMGVLTVISAILHIYYLQCKNSKVLILDEAYSAVSAGYIENFFTFLKQLCQTLQFKIILVTHDERLKLYGDKWYTVKMGKVSSHE